MNDLIEECRKKGIPVIDATRTEADFRAERFEQEEERLANHEFISNVKDEGCRIENGTQVVRRISFDYNFFESCLHLDEMRDFAAGREDERKRVLTEQLFNALEKAKIGL